MDGIKYTVFTEKILCLLGKNQYTFNVKLGLTKTEIKHWVELFFGVKVVAMNSHRLPENGGRIGPILGHTMHCRRMIITLQPAYSIPLLDREKTKGKYLKYGEIFIQNTYPEHMQGNHRQASEIQSMK